MTTFTKIAKAATSFSTTAKAVVFYIKHGLSSFLLKQDGGYLLLQNGGKIILVKTEGGKDIPTYTKIAKP